MSQYYFKARDKREKAISLTPDYNLEATSSGEKKDMQQTMKTYTFPGQSLMNNIFIKLKYEGNQSSTPECKVVFHDEFLCPF